MLEENVKSIKSDISSKAKSKIFDLIAAGIILAATAIILGVFELKELTWDSIVDILIEFVPLLLTATLLSTNYYTKGSVVGKASEMFDNIVRVYSKLVSDLTGEEISNMLEFCDEYNEKTLNKMKELELKKVAIPYEMYEHGDENNKPLKILTKKELKRLYSKEVWKTILRCKKLKIKGLKVNNLLGNEDVHDRTDLGKTEIQMRRHHNLSSTVMYIVSTAVMTLIAIKDINAWGWTSLILISFKILYIFFKSYMSYFDGYNDITVSLVNHIARKTDILKEFKFWFKNKKDYKID